MDNAIIIDVVFAGVLVVGYAVGAKRGLFKSLMGLVVVFAAMLGAALIANIVTPPVVDLLCPKIEEKMVTQFLDEHGEELDEAEEQKNTLVDTLRSLGLPEELMEKLILPAQQAAGNLKERVTEAYREAISESIRSIVTETVHAAALLISFLLLSIVLRFAVRVLDHVFDLPVLDTVNNVGGGVVGVAEAAMLLFVAARVLSGINAETFGALAEKTKLYAFFLNHSPLSLLNTLSE